MSDSPLSPAPPSLTQMLVGIPQVSSAQWQQMSVVTRWLVATRASVLPMTLFSVIFAGVLNPPADGTGWLLWFGCAVGLTLAHATNNLLNDYVDFRGGLDTGNYFRTRYGVHPLVAGLLSAPRYQAYIVVTGCSALLFALILSFVGGTTTTLFALAGAALVLFYTYPLKRIALGEIAVLAAWGPLMVGGVYELIHDTLPASVLWSGLAYGLGPTLVIFGKHTDKHSDDLLRGVRTLPNLLSKPSAARCIGYLAVFQWLLTIGVGFTYGIWGMLAIIVTLPWLVRLIRISRAPAPEQRPDDYPPGAWPLWYTTHAFIYGRWTGLAMIGGVLGWQLL